MPDRDFSKIPIGTRPYNPVKLTQSVKLFYFFCLPDIRSTCYAGHIDFLLKVFFFKVGYIDFQYTIKNAILVSFSCLTQESSAQYRVHSRKFKLGTCLCFYWIEISIF